MSRQTGYTIVDVDEEVSILLWSVALSSHTDSHLKGGDMGAPEGLEFKSKRVHARPSPPNLTSER